MSVKNIRYRTFLLLMLLAVVVLATVAIRYAEPISDGDIWFHLAYGRYFLENQTLIPDHTVFSWTPAENSTIYCAWIPEVIFYLLHKAGGLNMLYALRYLFIMVFIFLVFSLYKYKEDNIRFLPVMFLICLTGLLMSVAGLRIKAELFSFLLMTIMVWAWIRIKSRPNESWPLLYLFPLLILVWVNSHGGFIFGVLFLGVVFIGELLNSIVGSSEKLDPRLRSHVFTAVILSGFASLMTPYGWHYPVQLLNSLVFQPEEFKSHMLSIAEYHSILYPQASFLHFMDYLVVSAGIGLILLIAQLRKRRTDWAILLVNAAFMIIYIRYIRATYFFAIIFVFSTFYIIKQLSETEPDLLARKPLNWTVHGINLALLMFFILRVFYEVFCSPFVRTGYISPEAEARYILENFPQTRIGNDYQSGSYLLWSLWPEKKIFIDARYFPYREWYHEEGEFESYEDKAQIETFLKKYKCDLWCIAWDTPVLKYFITSPDWRSAYYGPFACVFVSKKINNPKPIRSVAPSVYEADLYQAYTIAKYVSLAGDIEVSQKIVQTMQPNPMSPQQIKLSIKARLIVGSNLFSHGRYYDAIEMYSDALRIARNKLIPDFFMEDSVRMDLAMIHNNLGSTYMSLNRIGEASREFAQALELQPGLYIAQKNLHLSMAQLNKIDESIEKLTNALKNNPGDSNSLNSLAVYYSMKGQYDNALDCLMKESTIRPDNPLVYYNIACIYSRQDRLKETIAYLDKAIAKGFDDWELLKKDHDLDNIRNSEYFTRLIQGR